jgi:hypothetical protein
LKEDLQRQSAKVHAKNVALVQGEAVDTPLLLREAAFDQSIERRRGILALQHSLHFVCETKLEVQAVEAQRLEARAADDGVGSEIEGGAPLRSKKVLTKPVRTPPKS